MKMHGAGSKGLAWVLILSFLPMGGNGRAWGQTPPATAPDTCRIADPTGRAPEWELRFERHSNGTTSTGTISASVTEAGTGREIHFMPTAHSSADQINWSTEGCDPAHRSGRYAGCVNLRLSAEGVHLEWHNPREAWGEIRAQQRSTGNCYAANRLMMPSPLLTAPRNEELNLSDVAWGFWGGGLGGFGASLALIFPGVAMATDPETSGVIHLDATDPDYQASLGMIGSGFVIAGLSFICLVIGLSLTGPASEQSQRLSRADREAVASLAPELERRGHAIESARSDRERRRLAQETVAWIEEELEGRVSDEGLAQLREIGERHLRTARARIPRRDGSVDLSHGPNPVFTTGTGLGVRF